MIISPQLLRQFLDEQQLPRSFADTVTQHYQPLLNWVLQHKARNQALRLAINGSQGSGKSTLAALLHRVLTQQAGWQVACLSIDDFYLTRAQRQSLAESVHPLLQTRGAPGTHDLSLALATVDKLCQLRHGEQLFLPRFDKAEDDRADAQCWPSVSGPLDLIVLEGWCVRSLPQPAQALHQAVNALEAEEDPRGDWRDYCNDQLQDYQRLFAYFDRLVLLQAPDFNSVFRWRAEQERKLAAHKAGSAIMNASQLRRFIQHYQRLTEWNLQTLPALADVVFQLDDQRFITQAIFTE